METTNVTPEGWEEQLIHYTIGAMEPHEAAEFAAALEQCRHRVHLAGTYKEVLGLLGITATPSEPPQGHKARLMQRLAAIPRDEAAAAARPKLEPVPAIAPSATYGAASTGDVISLPARRRASAWVWATGIAAVLLIGLAAWLVGTLGTVERQTERLAAVEQQIEVLQGQVNIPPGYRTVALAPTDEYTGVSALVIYDPNSTEAWLVADGLAPLPEDLIYELWIIRPQGQGQSEVGGVFGPTAAGTAVHRTAAQGRIADYAGFAVSIERKPGVPVREGPVVVVGSFEGQ